MDLSGLATLALVLTATPTRTVETQRAVFLQTLQERMPTTSIARHRPILAATSSSSVSQRAVDPFSSVTRKLTPVPREPSISRKVNVQLSEHSLGDLSGLATVAQVVTSGLARGLTPQRGA